MRSFRFGAIVAIASAIGTLAATTAFVIYLRLYPWHSVRWLDTGAEVMASYLSWAIEPTEDFNSKLESLIKVRLPELSSLPRGSYRFHVVSPAYQLSDVSAESLDWDIMSLWCNQIPARSDHYTPTGLRVDNEYAFFINALESSSELRAGTKRVLGLAQKWLEISQEESQLQTRARTAPLPQDDATRLNDLDAAKSRITRLYQNEVAATIKTRPVELQAFNRLKLAERTVSDQFGSSYVTHQCDTQPTSIKSWLLAAREAPAASFLFKNTHFSDATTKTSDADSESIALAKPHGSIPGADAALASLNGHRVSVGLLAHSVDVLRLERGDWFDRDLIKRKANGPWEGDQQPFWGPFGSFGLLPYALVVMYSPSVELKLSEKDYEAFQEWMRIHGSLVVGPFEMDGEGHTITTGVNGDRTVTFAPLTDRAYVIGLISIEMP